MHLFYPFTSIQEAHLCMYSYVAFAGVVFELRSHEVVNGTRIVEYRAGFTQDQEASVSLLDANNCWANPLLDGQRVAYLWRFEVPDTDHDRLMALNKLYRLAEAHKVTDESPGRLRRANPTYHKN